VDPDSTPEPVPTFTFRRAGVTFGRVRSATRQPHECLIGIAIARAHTGNDCPRRQELKTYDYCGLVMTPQAIRAGAALPLPPATA